MLINQFYVDEGNYHEFSLIHYISAKSFLDCNPNSELVIWTNKWLVSRWLELLKSEFKDRFSVGKLSCFDLQYDKFNCTAHLVDYIKLKKLYERGGMFVDSDMICLKECDEIIANSKFECNICEERDPLSHHFLQLSIGYLYSSVPGSPFVSDWIAAYETYGKNSKWTEHSGEVPTELWKTGKYHINIIPEVLICPYSYTRDDLRHIFLHNRPLGDAYMFHVSESICWDRYLKPLDIEHIMTVDTTFTCGVRRYVEHLWDNDRKISSIN